MNTVQTTPNAVSEHQTSHVDVHRLPNTKANGQPFDTATIISVWDKAHKDYGFFFFRHDAMGSAIAKHDYGKKNQCGWEIDHILPVSSGGTDDMENLQPLHWKNCQLKGAR